MDRVLDRIATVSSLLSGAVIMLMMVMIVVDAVGRKYGYPLPGGLELSEAMMVAVVYLSLMAVQRHRENVFVSIVTHAVPPRGQAVLDAVAGMIALCVCLVFTWVSWGRAWDAYLMGEYRVAAIEVPIWPFRFFIPFGVALLCIQLVAGIIRDLKSTRPAREEYLPDM